MTANTATVASASQRGGGTYLNPFREANDLLMLIRCASKYEATSRGYDVSKLIWVEQE